MMPTLIRKIADFIAHALLAAVAAIAIGFFVFADSAAKGKPRDTGEPADGIVVLTGVGTILADDPALNVRIEGSTRQPLRVVLDSRLRTPPAATILRPPGPNEAGGPVHVLCVAGTDPIRHGALMDAGAHVHELHVATDDGVDLRDVQTWLWERGLRRVLVEAGPRLLTHFLQAGFVDQVRIYTGAVNGGTGPSMAEWLQKLNFEQRIDRELAVDAVLEAFVVPGPKRR